MRYQFEQCIDKGKIVKIEIASDLISKEIEEAKMILIHARYPCGK